MPLTFHIREEPTSDFSLLTYAQHMARTARSDEARRLFERFLEQEGTQPTGTGQVADPSDANLAHRHESVRVAQGEETSVMQAKVDPVLCTGCGLCARLCPDIFELAGDRARVKLTSVPPLAEALCLHAMESCPAEALSLEV